MSVSSRIRENQDEGLHATGEVHSRKWRSQRRRYEQFGLQGVILSRGPVFEQPVKNSGENHTLNALRFPVNDSFRSRFRGRDETIPVLGLLSEDKETFRQAVTDRVAQE